MLTYFTKISTIRGQAKPLLSKPPQAPLLCKINTYCLFKKNLIVHTNQHFFFCFRYVLQFALNNDVELPKIVMYH